MNAIIFLNGEYKYTEGFIKNIISKEDVIFCADGGANYTYKYGITPNYIVGDLDSIDGKILEIYINNNNILIEKYNPEKDFTDFELILQKIENYKIDNNITFENIYVLGGLGKRLDMTLNNLHLLEEYKELVFLTEDEEIFYREKNFEIKNKRDHIFSIIPLSNKIEKLSLKGFKYEVDKMDVQRKSSRLVSNVIINTDAVVKFKNGKLLVIIQKKNEKN